jgi:type IV secretory pathway TrbL component
MAFASIVTLFFYLSVPFVAGAIMKGASGTTSALSAGINNTLQAVGYVAGAGATVAGAAATFGGSTAAQAAMASGQAVAGAASAASSGKGMSNDLAGSSASSSPGGSVPPPPGEEGGAITNPANPAMVAQQTTPESFSVTDQSKGTVSHHKGSLSTPHAAQAAFNSHPSKAKPSSSKPDNTNP